MAVPAAAIAAAAAAADWPLLTRLAHHCCSQPAKMPFETVWNQHPKVSSLGQHLQHKGA